MGYLIFLIYFILVVLVSHIGLVKYIDCHKQKDSIIHNRENCVTCKFLYVYSANEIAIVQTPAVLQRCAIAHHLSKQLEKICRSFKMQYFLPERLHNMHILYKMLWILFLKKRTCLCNQGVSLLEVLCLRDPGI